MAENKRIGIGMDFSKSSKAASKWAINNLADKGDTFYIIHVKNHDSRHQLCSKSSSPLIPLVEFREAEVSHYYDVETDIELLDMLDTATRQKQRVLWKQPLYLHEVVVRSAYTLPSPDPTLWDFTGYVIVVVMLNETDPVSGTDY